jgi:hypothetical protein
LRYFRELLRLKASGIFEEALGQHDIESLVTKSDWILQQIGFKQIRCRDLDGYVNTVVFDVRCEQTRQGRRSATNIQQSALFASCDLICYPRSLFEAKVRPTVVCILFFPQVLLMVFHRVRVVPAIVGDDLLDLFTGWVVHNRLPYSWG